MRPAQIKLSVRSTILRLLFSLLAAYMACGEAAAQNVVTDWNAIAVQTSAVNAKVPPGATAVNLAIMHLAMYDAVNSINGRFQPYAVKLQALQGASEDAAAGAHRVLVSLFPAQQAALDASYDSTLALIPDGTSKANGIAVGEAAALAILALRANDGRNATVGNSRSSIVPKLYRDIRIRVSRLEPEDPSVTAERSTVELPGSGTKTLFSFCASIGLGPHPATL